MTQSPSVIIIGAGIAGLSAGIYAQMNGYQARIYEMHNVPGGLMTAWKRKGYTIESCIHWLTGSSPRSASFYRPWQEIGLIQDRTIFDPEVFCRFENADGKVLDLYTDVDRLERHLLELAPEDRKPITEMCNSIRALRGFNPPGEISSFGELRSLLKDLPGLLRALPQMRKWVGVTMAQFADRFSNPFLREAFHGLWYPDITAVGLLVTMALLDRHDAGYPIGGSLPMAHAVEKRFCSLGGEIHYNCRVKKILTEPSPSGKGSRAVGVEFVDGRVERADVVISAADGHATLFDMLDGRFTDDKLLAMYRDEPRFPALVFIGLGVKRTFPDLPAMTSGVNYKLAQPITVAGKPVDHIEYRVLNFDPTLAPAGSTLVTVSLLSDYTYWKELSGEPERYEAEKQRVALEVIDRLDGSYPGLAGQVEMADVATPATFERYTGNWEGSFEGWLPTPRTMMKPYQYTLPELENFYMVGQWVQPGGGLPSGTMTGKAVVKMMCKKDGKKFRTIV